MNNSSINLCCPHIEISVLLDPPYKAIYDQVFFLLQQCFRLEPRRH